MPLAEYEALPFLQARPLWAAVAARCAAHARGHYTGFAPLRLANGFNGKEDLLVVGKLGDRSR